MLGYPSVNCPPDFVAPACGPVGGYDGQWDCQAVTCVAIPPPEPPPQTQPSPGLFFSGGGEPVLTKAQQRLKAKIDRLLLFGKMIPWRLADQASRLGLSYLIQPEMVTARPRPRSRTLRGYDEGGNMSGLGALTIPSRVNILYNHLLGIAANLYPTELAQVGQLMQQQQYSAAYPRLVTLMNDYYRGNVQVMMNRLLGSPAVPSGAYYSSPGGVPKWVWWAAGAAAAFVVLASRR